jgi:hypothetical protein
MGMNFDKISFYINKLSMGKPPWIARSEAFRSEQEQIWHGRHEEKRHHPTRGECVGGTA